MDKPDSIDTNTWVCYKIIRECERCYVCNLKYLLNGWLLFHVHFNTGGLQGDGRWKNENGER